MKDRIAIELVWLVTILLFTFIFVIGIGVAPRSIEIQFHDTYYIVDPSILNPLLFVILVFMAYVLKELTAKYSRVFSNWILIVVSLALAGESFALLRLFTNSSSICDGCPSYGQVFFAVLPFPGRSLLAFKLLGIISTLGAALVIARNISLIRQTRIHGHA